jgi:hypothetical protein
MNVAKSGYLASGGELLLQLFLKNIIGNDKRKRG